MLIVEPLIEPALPFCSAASYRRRAHPHILHGAIALSLAVPALAQQAPAPDPHAGHSEGEKAKQGCREMLEKMKGKGDAKPATARQQDHQGGQAHDH